MPGCCGRSATLPKRIGGLASRCCSRWSTAWEQQARWIRSEFGLGELSHHLSASTSGELNRRRLDALQQLSLAAATVLDPGELARVALDETLRILGAERAFLFLVDESGTLGQHRGRHADGTDLNVLTAYSASLVERVHASGKPLVVTSDEEGRALGSQSAAAHGLLSIMVAPLQLKGRAAGGGLSGQPGGQGHLHR